MVLFSCTIGMQDIEKTLNDLNVLNIFWVNPQDKRERRELQGKIQLKSLTFLSEKKRNKKM